MYARVWLPCPCAGAASSWACRPGAPARVSRRRRSACRRAVPSSRRPASPRGARSARLRISTVPTNGAPAPSRSQNTQPEYELLEEKRDGTLTRLRRQRADSIWRLVPARLAASPRTGCSCARTRQPRHVRIRRCSPLSRTPARRGKLGLGPNGRLARDGDGRGDRVRSARGTADGLTARFAQVARALAPAVKSSTAVLDGEDLRTRPERPLELLVAAAW